MKDQHKINLPPDPDEVSSTAQLPLTSPKILKTQNSYDMTDVPLDFSQCGSTEASKFKSSTTKGITPEKRKVLLDSDSSSPCSQVSQRNIHVTSQ